MRALVSFVLTGIRDQPLVQSQLFAGQEAPQPMQPLSGIADAWWAETTAPRDAATLYQFLTESPAELDAAEYADPEAIARYVRKLYEAAFADPWNAKRCYPLDGSAFAEQDGRPPYDKWPCVVSLPESPPFPWHDPPTRRGAVELFTVHSRVLGNSRTVSVWTPPGPGDRPLPLVVLLDGETFLLAMDSPLIFDNLMARKATPPFVAVQVHNATAVSRVREYPSNADFVRFLTDEMLPQVQRRYPVCVDAPSTTIGGYSLGGLAACWAAYLRPDVFGNVAAFSPSLWWGPPASVATSTANSAGTAGWLTRQYEQATDRRHLRFWLEVGILEDAPLPIDGGEHTMLSVARDFRDVLSERRYELVGYRETPGGHDCVNWRWGLAEALSALL